ncbi:FMN-dependent NADH-azoreductase [Enterococcus timonensis]|uniref:FMN-dependent NADH-azoreductase n=1 Tax=Enterococcus timonensis TaxID=1852364 RepID=UPI0008D9EF0E|nr:NAD(P)H-dependent oxidoreductase [Enterococcus timonensis]
MSNVLVVKAHPFGADKSRTIHILDVFMDAYRAEHKDDQIEVIDLFAEEFPDLDGPMIEAWGALANGAAFTDFSEQVQKNLNQFNASLAQYKKADKVVIANPMWNLNIPSKLKSWFDSITVVGETFRYTETGHIALLPGKKMVHIQAAGGKYDGKDPGSVYVHAILESLGTKRVAKINVEGMDHFPDQAKDIIAAAEKEAKEVAKTF